MAATLVRICLSMLLLTGAAVTSDPTQELKDALMARFSDRESMVARILAPIAAAAKTPAELEKIKEMADHLRNAGEAKKWEDALFRDEADEKNIFTVIKVSVIYSSIVDYLCAVQEKVKGHEEVVRATLRPLFARIDQGDRHLDQLMRELSDTTWSQRPGCGPCRVTMTVLRVAAYLSSWSTLRDYLNLICRVLLPDITPEWYRADLICPGTLDSQGPLLYDILRGEFTQDGILPIDLPITLQPSPLRLCEYLNVCFPDEEEPADPENAFLIPKVSYPKLETQKWKAARRPVRKSRDLKGKQAHAQNVIKFVQMADVHIEPDYDQGALTPCGLPVCCQLVHGEGTSGRWGDHFCNLPRRTADHMFHTINAAHSPEFVIYSGDNAPHSVWVETPASQLHSTVEVVESIAQNFPGIHAYATIGNHEMYPTNVYSMNYLQHTRDLNAEFTGMFGTLGGFGPEQNETMAAGGYYTTVIQPGLRIVVYNTNYMYTFNWMNVHNDQSRALPPNPYPAERQTMKDWMEGVMTAAATANESVILSGHHPPGRSDYLVRESHWLVDFILRHHDIIVLHITGHTHRDDFKLITDPETGEARSVINIAPTMNGYNVANPTIRVWSLDPVTFRPVDFENYYIDVMDAGTNETPPLVRRSYSAREEYDMPDLSPNSWKVLADRLDTENVLLQRFMQHYHSHTRPGFICNEACRITRLCNIRNPSFEMTWTCIDSMSAPAPTTTTEAPATCPTYQPQPIDFCRCPLAWP